MTKQILIGAEFFGELIEGDYFYIDKTLFIKELIEKKGKVTLITRPRRFGKTMNLDMLRSFFDITRESKALFKGLKITEYKNLVEKHQNQYPVIFMSLKDISANNFDETIENIRILISFLYRQHKYLYDNDILDKEHKEFFYCLYTRKSSLSDLKFALRILAECLYSYHKKRVIILLDEYDAPLDCSVRNNYYKEMIDFMRGFLGNVFKTNDFLEFGVLTGVLRIARESLFSSFNNPKICGIMDKEFSSCFGFTEDEVKESCEMFGIKDLYPEVKKWYDGYRFGGQDMYNPWSITYYLNKQVFENFWVNTGDTSVLKDVFLKGDDKLKDDLAGLLTGKPISMSFKEAFTYPIEHKSSNTFWSLLLTAGYIKPCNGAKTEIFTAELVNKEISNVFTSFAQEWLDEKQTTISENIKEFVEYLLKGDAIGVQTILNEDLLNNPSCHDFKAENSYHMFIFGILLAVAKDYVVYSNPESGKGRSDCLIKPHDKAKYAVVVEFKHLKKTTSTKSSEFGVRNSEFRTQNSEFRILHGGEGVALKDEAQKGLAQINEKVYIHTLHKEGYTKIYKYSIAFYQKNCEVMMEIENERFHSSITSTGNAGILPAKKPE